MVYKGNKRRISFIRWDQHAGLAFFDVWNLGLGNCITRFWILTALVVFKLYPICLFTTAYMLYAVVRKCSFNGFFHLVTMEFTAPVFRWSMEQTNQNHTFILSLIRSKIWDQYVCALPNTEGSRCLSPRLWALVMTEASRKGTNFSEGPFS